MTKEKEEEKRKECLKNQNSKIKNQRSIFSKTMT
jgi:hypothetical protein